MNDRPILRLLQGGAQPAELADELTPESARTLAELLRRVVALGPARTLAFAAQLDRLADAD